MAASGRHGGRPFVKSGRFRARHESADEILKLDFSRDPNENLKEILAVIVSQSSVPKSKKLAYLNALVKLLLKYGNDKYSGFTKRDILCCLRVGLFHEAKEVRAAVLRVLRYFLRDQETVDLFYTLHIDYLIVRSIDLCLDNEVERIHGIKLVRKILQIAPKKLSDLLFYPLVAISNDGTAERDRMVRIALETICETAFVNPELLARCGGIGAILRAALDCHQYPRINESLVSTILHLLNHPRTRHFIKFNTDLEQLLAPFTDCHYRFSAESSEQSSGEEKENRFAASKMAVVSIMRTWSGIIRFCRPDGSGLQSLVGILYLPYKEIRHGILEILFDLFRLKIPESTDDFNTALLSVDPSEMQENWKITDGFVAEEGKCILPHMAKIRPNLIENHLALLLSAWIGAGILEALVEVIISSDRQLFVRATILLGDLLHLASTMLPPECSHHNHCLPSLLALASSPDLTSAQTFQAREAIYYLERLHAMKKRGPVPSSLYLDQLIQRNGGRPVGQTKFYLRKKYDLYINKSPTEDMIGQAIKDSNVVNTKDIVNWDWDLVPAILKWPEEKLRRLDDQLTLKFFKRLVQFYKPTNHRFSRLEINHKLTQMMVHSGCLLVDFLLSTEQDEVQKLALDFIGDIGGCMSEIAQQRLVPESVLSPGNVINTCSQFYFLFVGRFSGTVLGDKYLEKTGVYQYLLDIVSIAPQDSFVKLSVSSLNYSKDGNTRPVLAKALCSATESARLYCTKFLRTLLRTRVAGFSTWGMELLVNQLYDQSNQVAQAALHVLEEACDVQPCLSSVIKLRPQCLHLGERGVLLLCRFMSTSKGFKMLSDANFIHNEVQKWEKTYNVRYIHIVEDLLNEALTTYEKTYEGSFTRRSSRKRSNKDAYVPVHLYGQLTQHKEGFNLLQQQECIGEFFKCIKCLELHSDEDVLKMKTALWAVGHIGTSTWGVNWLEEERLLPEIIKLAEECGVFSIRGTAFYVLGLLTSTREGAEYLTQLGWESCWHTREDRWPVVEDRTELLTELQDSDNGRCELESRGASSPGILSSSLFFIEEENSALDQGCESGLIHSCDQNSNIEASMFIPKRSKTLPNEIAFHKRYKSLPSRTANIRSYSLGHHDRDRIIRDDHRLMTRRLNSPSRQTEDVLSNKSHSSRGSEKKESPKNIPVICLSDMDSGTFEGSMTEDVDSKAPICDNFSAMDDEGEGISFSVKDSDEKSDTSETKTLTNQSLKKSPNLRDGRCSSSDSSRTSNKSRADSFNTDSTTSGVSSCESGPHTCLSSEFMSLSPIASTSSIDTLGVTGSSDARDLIHPSSFRRKSLNLKRVPSLRNKQASPAYGILPSAQLLEGMTTESAIMYTTSRDAMGYATWRSIKRQRRISSDVESDMGLNSLYGEEEGNEMIRKNSIESKKSIDTFTFRSSSGIPRNASSVSLSDQERAGTPYGVAPKAILLQRRPHTGEAEFLGLTLPVDINMMFQVHAGEDQRSEAAPVEKEENYQEQKKKPRSRKSSRIVPALESFEHDSTVCLLCSQLKRQDISQSEIEEGSQEDGDLEPVSLDKDPGSLNAAIKLQKGSRPRHSSVNEPSSATPGSVTSCTSSDSLTVKMSYDNVHGKGLIRKELRKLVINLSSSVGLKGSEQGLLMLKQKFPAVFKDVCFYSEVCHLLSICSFRLNARRFVQELFEDFKINKLIAEPYSLTSMVEGSEKNVIPVTKFDNLDSLSEYNQF
ncbi:rapamycin-insensitive companion of mTOR-like [Saccostrea echinata]|uniref:rapamycin-insensitive companion of mTOR-like n=1 Tax=Saccostrea echinata TaxID=191078 RepID=UPI002A82260B|nr:rapamycin-insensitive companion of mTOR-like [Saccostrea echinata]